MRSLSLPFLFLSLLLYIKRMDRLLVEKVNILLVRNKGRTACLLEPTNFFDTPEVVETLVDFAKSLKLFTRLDKEKRILITRERSTGELTDVRIGQYLDFLCYNDDYANLKEDRYGASVCINDIQVHTEVCLANKHSKSEIQSHIHEIAMRWRRILAKLDIKVNITERVTLLSGHGKRYQLLLNRQLESILKYKDEFLNDLENAQGRVGYLYLMLRGCDNADELSLFISPLTNFYQFAVIDDSLEFPHYNGENEPDIRAIAMKHLKYEQEYLCASFT